MGAFLITLIGGAVAGALASRYAIRHEVSALREMLQDGQQRPASPPPPAPVAAAASPAPPPTPVAQTEPAVHPPEPGISGEITPEILMVLTAAVAAFLGKKAKIRRARLAGPALSGNAWAQQGRVFVQASHNLSHHR